MKYLTYSEMILTHAMVYAMCIVAIEFLFCFFLYVFSTEEDIPMCHDSNELSKGWNDCIYSRILPKERMTLFVSTSVTRYWSSEYAIIVVFHHHRAFTTRIIDVSHLAYNVKAMFRKYEHEYLNMIVTSNESTTGDIKIDSKSIRDSDKMSPIISHLLRRDTKTDLHKIPLKGVRILYLTVQF